VVIQIRWLCDGGGSCIPRRFVSRHDFQKFLSDLVSFGGLPFWSSLNYNRDEGEHAIFIAVVCCHPAPKITSSISKAALSKVAVIETKAYASGVENNCSLINVVFAVACCRFLGSPRVVCVVRRGSL
jgi:hypothetical protein